MLGIIVWAVLIFVIIALSCPGFITMITIAIAAYIVLLFLLSWVRAKIFDGKQIETKEYRGEVTRRPSGEELEKAIDEWEKKWGRKHPTRINK